MAALSSLSSCTFSDFSCSTPLIGNWALPVVCVAASPQVEKSLACNNLSFCELLKPFGVSFSCADSKSSPFNFHGPTRSVNLHQFGVRFVSFEECTPPDPKLGENYLDGVLRRAKPKPDRMNDQLKQVEDIKHFFKKHPDPCPWYGVYRQEWLETLQYSEFELLDQPHAVLIAVSSSEPDPQAVIDALWSIKNFPAFFQNGIFDFDALLRCIVLVHDQHSDANGRENAEKQLSQLRKRFGPENVCNLLEINSAPITAAPSSDQDIWAPHCMRSRTLFPSKPVKECKEATATATANANDSATPKPELNDDSTSASPITAELVPHAANASQPATPCRPAVGIANPTTILSNLHASFSLSSTASGSASSSISASSSDSHGRYLSQTDRALLINFVSHFLSKMLLPSLEKKLSALFERVSAERKGIKNQLKAFFGRRPGDSNKKGSHILSKTRTYNLGSPESHARQLADLAFLMQHYELAAANYRIVAADYKLDEHWKYYANANEMLGVSLALLDWHTAQNPAAFATNPKTALGMAAANQREMSTAFDAALSSYTQLSDVRHSTRAAIFYAEALRQSTNYAEATGVLLRASEKEVGVRGALILEQLGYLYLQQGPAHLRKYAFHLVLAGHLFHRLEQRIHGVRCYASAAEVYSNRGWIHIEDHVLYNLGKDSYHLADFAAAVNYFVRLIGRAKFRLQKAALSITHVHQSSRAAMLQDANSIMHDKRMNPQRQKNFLNEFVLVVKKWPGGDKKEVAGLQLPAFLDATISVSLNDLHSVPLAFQASVWNAVSRSNPMMALKLDECNRPLFSATVHQYKDAERGVIVRERITVKVDVVNPLAISLSVNNIRLRCKHVAKDDNRSEEVESKDGEMEDIQDAAVEAGDGPEHADNHDGGVHTGSITRRRGPVVCHQQSNTSFLFSQEFLTLAAHECKTLFLSVVPLKEGVMHIEGVQWNVCEVLRGFHPFALPPRRTNVPARRKAEFTVTVDNSLLVPVLPSLPLLRAKLVPPPKSLLHSETVSCRLLLKNDGHLPLDRIQVRISHPAFVVVGKAQSLTSAAHSSFSQEIESASKAAPFPVCECYEYLWSEGVIQLDVSLAAGAAISLPVWIRGAVPGKHDLQFLFKYCPVFSANAAAAQVERCPKFRLCYLHYTCTVQPLFSVKAFTRPSLTRIADTLLGVEIIDARKENQRKPVVLHVRQASALSHQWAVSATGSQQSGSSGSSQDNTTEHTLFNKESLVIYFRARSILMAGTVMKPVDTTYQPPTSAHNSRQSVKPIHSLVVFSQPSLKPAVCLDASTLSAQIGAALRREEKMCPSSGEASDDVDLLTAPFWNSLWMEKALMIEEERVALMMNPKANVADVAASNRLDLALVWRSDEGGRCGIFYLPGLNCMKAAPQSCELKVLVEYPRRVIHQFKKFPILEVSVTLQIRNNHDDSPVTFTFETLNPDEEFDAVHRAFKPFTSSALRCRYLWRGCTRARIVDLPCGDHVPLTVRGCFFHSGEYNINRFRFSVEVAGTKPRTFFFPLQHIITVIDADSMLLENHVTAPAVLVFASEWMEKPIAIEGAQHEEEKKSRGMI